MKKGIDYIGVSVGAMIFNDKNELFLAKRSQQCRNEKGFWEAPGGSVEFGEKLIDAIRREMREEFAMQIKIITQFPAADHILLKEKQHWVPTTFLVSIKNDNNPKIMEPEKCDEIGWFSLNNLPSPLSVITKLDLKYYRKNIQRLMK